MKKLSLLCLSLLAAFGLAACGSNTDDAGNSTPAETPVTFTGELDSDATSKIAICSIGGSGLGTIQTFFEDYYELDAKTDAASVTVGESFYKMSTATDYDALTSDYVVYVAVEFSGKGEISINDQSALATALLTKKTSVGFKMVLCGVDGTKNRGTNSEVLWTALTPSADKIIVAKTSVNYDNYFTGEKVINVEGSGSNLLKGCANAVATTYNALASE